MLKMIFSVLGAVLKIFRLPAFFFLLALSVFALMVIYNIYKLYKSGKRIEKGAHVTLKKRSFLRRIFLDLPKQYAIDYMNREADFFPYQGLIVYCGRQGHGKTVSMVHDMMQIQKEYPRCKVMTNFAYTKEDKELKHWKPLIKYKNGHFGVVACLDELQNWFSSNQSKNFPPEMLQVITQNRKNRRVIFGTAQNFYLLAKAIRSQTVEVRDCMTLFGCLTIVHRKEPVLDAAGDVVEWENRGFYFFVHDEELRDSYDTYKVIDSLADSGFKDTADSMSA